MSIIVPEKIASVSLVSPSGDSIFGCEGQAPWTIKGKDLPANFLLSEIFQESTSSGSGDEAGAITKYYDHLRIMGHEIFKIPIECGIGTSIFYGDSDDSVDAESMVGRFKAECGTGWSSKKLTRAIRYSAYRGFRRNAMSIQSWHDRSVLEGRKLNFRLLHSS